VRDLFRALHTLKGLAGMMGVQPIVELAHAFETVVRAADQAGGRLSARAVELGLHCVRAIAERVRSVADNVPIAAAPEALIDELARVDGAEAGSATTSRFATNWDRKLSAGERQQVAAALERGRKIYTLTFTPSEEGAARGVSIGTVRPAVAKLGEIIKVAPRAVPPSVEAPAGLLFELLVVSDADVDKLAAVVGSAPEHVEPLAVTASAELPALAGDEESFTAPIGRSFVRVELARLDDLQEQLSALVVTRFRIERQIAKLAEAGADVRALREIADVQGRQLRDLRRGILRARMVRVAEVLEPLSLLVRSLVKPGIKEVKLEVEARDTELDKAVADRLLPAIVHLVRNAVDHAIEPIVEREHAGKPRVGRIRISCYEAAGNQLELSISDDGRGVDRVQIATRAGKPIEDEAALLDVLTTPGFSTRTTATQTSGRGLGMDIVRRIAMRELGGELSLMTDVIHAAGNDKITRLTDLMGSTTRRMKGIIDQLLDVTRARLGGGIPVTPAETDLEGVVSSVLEELSLAYPSAQIEPKLTHVRGTWDPDRLAQVVSNLVNNAIQHGPPASPVWVETEQQGDNALLRVRNKNESGIALTEEQMAKFFSPFRTSRRTQGAGLGLGLYITSEILRAHHGALSIESDPNMTTFVVRLPITAQ
jgi:signal transduction histidine kinase